MQILVVHSTEWVVTPVFSCGQWMLQQHKTSLAWDTGYKVPALWWGLAFKETCWLLLLSQIS